MGEKMVKAASLLLAASLLTGCSLTNTASGTPDASGGAVSGSVAVEDGEEVLATKSKSYLENSDNRYDSYYDEDKEVDYIVQYRLDGTLVKKSKIEIYEIEWVTDEWLYYSTEDIETYSLWRIPIKKTEEGDRLLTDKKEKILDAYALEVDYATDSYIIVEIYDFEGDKERNGVYKYDPETGKQTELIKIGEYEEPEVLQRDTYPLMWKGNLFFEGYDKLYILDPEKGRASSLYSFKGPEEIDDYALIGNEFYFFADNQLYRSNCSTKETECVIAEKKFREAIQNQDLNLGNVEYIMVGNMYLNQGRLYFDIYAKYIKKKSGSREEADYENELFSVSLDDFGKLRHEDRK